MIWFCQALPIVDPPKDTEIFLIGEFNPNQQPLIQINLEIGKDKYQLFTRTPSGNIPEDVEPDDILAKYNHKISKFKHRFSNEGYAEIVKLVQARYPVSASVSASVPVL